MLPHQCNAWAELEALAGAGAPRIADLFRADKDRLVELSLDVCGIHFDFSKLPLGRSHFALLQELGRQAGLADWRRRLAEGEIINPSEQQPAGHMQLRDPAASCQRQVAALAGKIRSGAMGTIRHVIHIGIGGSALGPELLVDAFDDLADGPKVHFVTNIDGLSMRRACAAADPAQTLVIAVSKTFRTSETRMNLRCALDWLRRAGLAEGDIRQRVIAVTADAEAAQEQGVSEVQSFDPHIGGRYSLWSAVGLSFAIRCGGEAFSALLAGAHQMDCHFQQAPFAANAPVMAAMADVWLASFLHRPTRAVFAYDERLRLLPNYLQQLEMESNGKSVARDGTPLPFATAPIVWGGVGTCAQHAVFQLLHQGSHDDPVEFLAVRQPEPGQCAEHYPVLLANCLAQSAALLKGRSLDEARAMANGDEALAHALAFPGNRGSTTILIDRLTPERLGALLAFYEARTFTAGVLMGINSFDQWGVELGKEMAQQLLGGAIADADPSTQALMQLAGLQTSKPD